jgi:carbon storage regulator CsrA
MGMLVLERYEKEGIRIDDDVLIHVNSFGHRKNAAGDMVPYVKIGILAPQSKRILREELWNASQVESADATDKT